MLLIYPVTYSMLTLWCPRFLFPFILLNFCHLYWERGVSILSIARVWETGIREEQMYEKWKQTYVDNIVNDLYQESLKIM